MLKPKCFVIGIVLSLSLQAKAITYCPCPPIGAIVRKQKLDKERREREQKERHKLLKQREKKKKRRRERNPVFLTREVRKMFDEIKKQNKEIIKLLHNTNLVRLSE